MLNGAPNRTTLVLALVTQGPGAGSELRDQLVNDHLAVLQVNGWLFGDWMGMEGSARSLMCTCNIAFVHVHVDLISSDIEPPY
jgi:hypothetical protein